LPIESPQPVLPNDDGIVALGGRPDVETLLAAYSRGIFPWPHDDTPLLWFCPDPRFVLRPQDTRLSRSLRKTLRHGGFEVRFDTAFEQVVDGCRTAPRPGQDGTWITDELIAGFVALHRVGVGHSVETYRDGELMGGLYGLSLGGMFFGESMFARASDASKVAFATLLAHLVRWEFELVDCQVHTAHLERFGAVEIPRDDFLDLLGDALGQPTRRGPWDVEMTTAEGVEVLVG
jgi:leucyl/phenylalanyl-tRNA--protein transferase